jgi:hypothetical protein
MLSRIMRHTGQLIMTKSLTLLIALGLVLAIRPSAAAEVTLQKTSAEGLKAVCEKMGGSFSQADSGYGCGTDCHGGKGTDCVVFCPTSAKRCTAQVDGARRPKTFEQALGAGPKRKR